MPRYVLIRCISNGYGSDHGLIHPLLITGASAYPIARALMRGAATPNKPVIVSPADCRLTTVFTALYGVAPAANVWATSSQRPNVTESTVTVPCIALLRCA